MNKNYGTISQKYRLVGNTQKSQKVKIKLFFPNILIFLFPCKAMIHSIWTSDEKVIDNFVFQSI